MYGLDVFAVLTPWREKYWANTIQAFSHAHNAKWLEKNLVDSREPTPALPSASDSGQDTESANSLLLKFEQLKSANEIQFGTDEKVSHILLKFSGIKAVSRRQFVIVVRPDNTISLKDQHSSYGTRVTHDGNVEKELAPKEYILAGRPGLSKGWNEVVIHTGNLAYTIDFPNHPAGSPEYLRNLKAFRERNSADVALFSALDFHSNPTTEEPSQPFTPHGKERSGYLDVSTIASSSSRTIVLVQSMRDWKFYVRKTILTYPRPPQPKGKRKRDRKTSGEEEKEQNAHEAWFKNFRSQMELLKTIDHPNILRVIDYDESPNPSYHMPYYQMGTLEDLYRRGIHEDMFPKIFLQLLLGLRELHKLGFAHRDLKEENILVDDDLTLVFGDPDFMKSANDNALKTICGTGMYAAPEIWNGSNESYGISVDIWSVAITVMRIFYDVESSGRFPGPWEEAKLKAWNSKWYTTVLRKLDELDEDNDQIVDILKLMLKLDPAERSTVEQCLERGCENGLFSKDRLGGIVLAGATEVPTAVHTPTRASLPKADLYERKTPTNPNTADLSFTSLIRLAQGPSDAVDGTIPQGMFPFIPELPSFSTYDNLITTNQAHENDSHGSASTQTPTAYSQATFQSDSPGPPARRLKQSSQNESDWSWTVALEVSSQESNSTSQGQPARRNKEDLSKLRVTKQTFSSSCGSSLSKT
ncbi:MAG: hypothetical protein Q9220_005250 [cf. Caloplaca sp. 1 TL-2023]